jgi:hypothetical protein
MVLESLCPPALIYSIFALVSIIGETINGKYNTAFIGFWVMIIMTTLLNYLCSSGLSIISWIIVFIPFILNTLIIILILLSVESLFLFDRNIQQKCSCLGNDENCNCKKSLPKPIVPSTTGNKYFDNYNDANVNKIIS